MALSYSGHEESWVRERQLAPDLEIDDEILDLWRCGMNSAEIARLMEIPECLVASRIPRVLEKARTS